MSLIRWHFFPEFELHNVFVATPAHDLHSFVQLALNRNAILNLSSARKKQRSRKRFRIVDRGKNSETIFSLVRSRHSFVFMLFVKPVICPITQILNCFVFRRTAKQQTLGFTVHARPSIDRDLNSYSWVFHMKLTCICSDGRKSPKK